MTKKQLQLKLKELNIEFDNTMTIKELRSLYNQDLYSEQEDTELLQDFEAIDNETLDLLDNDL